MSYIKYILYVLAINITNAFEVKTYNPKYRNCDKRGCENRNQNIKELCDKETIEEEKKSRCMKFKQADKIDIKCKSGFIYNDSEQLCIGPETEITEFGCPKDYDLFYDRKDKKNINKCRRVNGIIKISEYCLGKKILYNKKCWKVAKPVKKCKRGILNQDLDLCSYVIRHKGMNLDVIEPIEMSCEGDYILKEDKCLKMELDAPLKMNSCPNGSVKHKDHCVLYDIVNAKKNCKYKDKKLCRERKKHKPITKCIYTSLGGRKLELIVDDTELDCSFYDQDELNFGSYCKNGDILIKDQCYSHYI